MNRPLYPLDNTKNSVTQAKSGKTISRGSILVEIKARWISVTPVNVELALKYVGTALAMNGETRTAPKTMDSNQEKTWFLEVLKSLGKAIIMSTEIPVMPTKTTVLKEWVKNIELTKTDVEIRNGTSENLLLWRNK